MKRLIGIDFGEKRVGIAVTDPSQIIAYPLETVSNKDVIEFLNNYLKCNQVEKIILGFATNMDGSMSLTSTKIENFRKRLANSFSEIDVVLYNERYTSKLASRDMFLYGLNKKDRHNKANVDKVSAAILLQFFMEFERK